MYEGLIADLRYCADKGESCGFCKHYKDGLLCLDNMLMQAADAIEELSKPRWIPVTERLPEKNGKYLCNVKRFGQYAGMQYYYVDVLVFQEDSFFEDGIGTERVTHWMPLPTPPKEDAE